MKYCILLAGLGLVSAGPVQIREVPQEHSHNRFLALVRTSLATNNPKKIQDPVFGLLGNAAAAAGAGSVTNLDCLQQETADQAFTNAKAAGDIAGMAGALLYRAIERNTGKVGLASVICNETATNAEIAALSQHQDPASTGAAATNKAITLALAKQLAAVGADPLLALESGTFAPGSLTDTTAKGNTCDTENDDPGCIFSQNLLVLDASVAEISAAVAGITPTISGTGAISATDISLAGLTVASGGAAATSAATSTAKTTAAAAVSTSCPTVTVTQTANANAAASTSCPDVTVTATCSLVTTTVAASTSLATVTTAAAAAATSTASSGSGTNVQKFTGTLGAAAPAIESSTGARPFTVNGNTFVNLAAAVQRSCDVQRNQCFNAANGGTLSGGTAQCDTQATDCVAANSAAAKRAAPALVPRASFGSCGNPTILFESGLDGRTTNAFIAEDQTDFNHGSALNIAVIAGFICQRLGSPCNADAAVQASCTSASAAAVATSQDQAAADVFNSILGVAGAAATTAAVTAVTTAAASATVVAAAAASTVLTITQCS